MIRTGRFLLYLAAATCLTGIGQGGAAPLANVAQPQAGDRNAPVSFSADRVSYDKSGQIVTAEGHVRAIQNGQTLTADKVSFDRTTGMVTASGHVTLTQPDGTSVYAKHAVLSRGMKDAVLRGVAARLAENARIIANGARRTDDGKIDELAKAVYSACDLCKRNPRAAPTWTITARTVTRDLEHHMIEYHDAEMRFYGIPVFYTPFLSQPDPSVKRQSGLLIPSAGATSRLGFFFTVPYYFVLGKSSDLTLTPVFASKQGPALRANYRRAFNDGDLNINLSGGRDQNTFGSSIFANGTFDLNRAWRAGFDFNRASNPTYLNDFNILPNTSYLTSDLYLEGFGPGAYARLDAQMFQGLVVSVNQSEVPIVAPHLQYHFLSGQDALGGRFSLDADMFNVLRKLGTNTRRVALIPGYAVPFFLPDGVEGTARVRLVAAGYDASRLYQQPNYSTYNATSTARVQPYGAVMLRWPLIRPAGAYGTQLIEPEVQFVLSPNVGISQNARIPNEDSLDLEFSDANLFALNRYPGIDRLGGGARVDYALHAAWYLPDGASLDGLIGQSYQFHKSHDYLPGSGLTDNVSDIVARLVAAPVPWFDISYRTRLSHRDLGARMIDATADLGTKAFKLSGGYLYSNTNPYVLYDSASPTGQVTLDPPAGYFTPRREFTASASTSYGGWSFSAGVQRNLQTGKFDSANASLGWQNDCFGANLIYYQRFTSFNLDTGNTLVLLQFTFKTLGNIGFSAL